MRRAAAGEDRKASLFLCCSSCLPFFASVFVHSRADKVHFSPSLLKRLIFIICRKSNRCVKADDLLLPETASEKTKNAPDGVLKIIKNGAAASRGCRREEIKSPRKMHGDFGGTGWIRNTEVTDNRFTVCPLWPLGNAPNYKASHTECTRLFWSW